MSKTFNQTIESDKGTINLVDGLNLAFRYKHSKVRHFADDYIKTVKSLQKSYKAAHSVILSDFGSSSFRNAIYPEYKANRAEKFADQSEADKKAFEEFLEDYNETLELISQSDLPLLRFKGVEADDLSAYICINRVKFNIDKIWLISTDKDWDLLVDDYISRFSYITRKEITLNNWDTHYEWTQDEHLDIKCLMGDAGDNVPGAANIGPKRALGLVRQYGSALDVAMALPITSKYKFIQNINEFGMDNILRNYQLMDLKTYCKDAIGSDNITKIDSLMENLINGS